MKKYPSHAHLSDVTWISSFPTYQSINRTSTIRPAGAPNTLCKHSHQLKKKSLDPPSEQSNHPATKDPLRNSGASDLASQNPDNRNPGCSLSAARLRHSPRALTSSPRVNVHLRAFGENFNYVPGASALYIPAARCVWGPERRARFIEALSRVCGRD